MIKWFDVVGGLSQACHCLSTTLLLLLALWHSFRLMVRHSLATYQLLIVLRLLFRISSYLVNVSLL